MLAGIVGPCPCFVLAAVIRGGKTMANGKVGYCGSVRHRYAELCPHGLLALYLCHRFTVRGEQFPFPGMAGAVWFHTALWKGNNPSTNISYDQQAKSFKAVFKKNDVAAKKITHAPRVAGARLLDDHGVDDVVSAFLTAPLSASHNTLT
jgi:hypothetical protein